MKLTIEIETDHEALLGVGYDVPKLLRELADDLAKNTMFARNKFTCELRDQYGECVVGYVTHSDGEVNDYERRAEPDGSIIVSQIPKRKIA